MRVKTNVASSSQPLSRRNRIRDLLLEIGIAITLVALVLVYAARVPPERRVDFRWVGLVASTAVTFGYALRWCRRYWRLVRFWLAFVALLSAHSVIFTFVLLRVEEWRLMWFAFVGFAEFFAVCYVLDAVGRRSLKGPWGAE